MYLVLVENVKESSSGSSIIGEDGKQKFDGMQVLVENLSLAMLRWPVRRISWMKNTLIL